MFRNQKLVPHTPLASAATVPRIAITTAVRSRFATLGTRSPPTRRISTYPKIRACTAKLCQV